MRFYFGAVALILVVLVVVHSPVQWDAATYLFATLDAGTPFTTLNRWITFPAATAALFTSQFTDRMDLIAVAFSLVYALMTFAPLAAAWYIVRDEARGLFVWVAFGFTLVLLPALFRLYSESILALEFIWPVFLATLVSLNKPRLIVVLVFSAALLISHPYAIPLFGIAALSAFFMGLREPTGEGRRRRWALAGLMLLFLILAVVKVFGLPTIYEEDRMSLGTIIEGVRASRRPLVAMTFVLVAGVLVFVTTRNPNTPRRVLFIRLAAVALVCALVVLVYHVSNPVFWRGTWYKFVMPFVATPFMLFAFLDRLLLPTGDAEASANRWRLQRGFIQASAAMAVVVLAVQSITWVRLNQQLTDLLATTPEPCLELTSLPWLQWTQIDFDSLPMYALMAQGKRPRAIVFRHEDCEGDFSARFPIGYGSTRGWEPSNWFDFTDLRAALIE